MNFNFNHFIGMTKYTGIASVNTSNPSVSEVVIDHVSLFLIAVFPSPCQALATLRLLLTKFRLISTL